MPKGKTMIKQQFPPGWDESRVRAVLEHYENQTEDEQYEEIEAAFEAEGMTTIVVPNRLVPAIHKLLAEWQAETKSA